MFRRWKKEYYSSTNRRKTEKGEGRGGGGNCCAYSLTHRMLLRTGTQVQQQEEPQEWRLKAQENAPTQEKMGLPDHNDKDRRVH